MPDAFSFEFQQNFDASGNLSHAINTESKQFNSVDTDDTDKDILSVSGALKLAKSSLESLVLTIEAEVSEVSIKPGYKAAYFTVKDSKSSLPCMMWNNCYKEAGFDLRLGQLVQLKGRFTLYAAKGRMNFDVFSLTLAGEGNLRLKVANIAKKLQAEGLTSSSRKRAIPNLCERIGLVTSPRSAAVHDVLRTLRRRFPLAEILLAGVAVEGQSAPEGIIAGIKCVLEAGAQVVLVVRGGGSFEDMMPFNDEKLARTIAACPVPVVTGIGHEVDTCIADMVADFRASTPTAAAEAISPSSEELLAVFSNSKQALNHSLLKRLQQTQSYLDLLASRSVFSDPMLLFAADAQTLDLACDRLQRALPLNIERSKSALDALKNRLALCGPGVLDAYKRDFITAASRLSDLSPVNILARGYLLARNKESTIVRSVEQVEIGSKLSLTLADGSLECLVEGKNKAEVFTSIDW